MRLLLLPILCLLLGVVTSELQTFQAGVALIGRYVINKTPSANPVQFIKSFMEPLIQAAQWPAENGIAPLEVMFGISGNMSMRISEETKKRLEEHLKHSKTTYAKFLKDSAALLERENDLKESLQNQLHLKLVTQIAAAQKVVSEYLEEPSDINKAKLIRKFEEPAMSQCGEEFTKSAELVMAQFFADQLQAKAYKYEDFEKIFQIVWRSRMELSSMAILYHTVKSNGDGRVVGNFLKDEQKQIQSLKALEKQKKLVDCPSLSFCGKLVYEGGVEWGCIGKEAYCVDSKSQLLTMSHDGREVLYTKTKSHSGDEHKIECMTDFCAKSILANSMENIAAWDCA
ncbi:unnamed protein product, partial [Mesorhabditis spiculigera]